MKQFCMMALLGTLLSSSVALRADDDHDKHRERTDNRRYYDKYNKDYHTWGSDEDQAWHSYLESNHRPYREFNHASKREQEQYFKWRHQHNDNHDRDDRQRHDH